VGEREVVRAIETFSVLLGEVRREKRKEEGREKRREEEEGRGKRKREEEEGRGKREEGRTTSSGAKRKGVSCSITPLGPVVPLPR
jgi:hypothetical protein